MADAHADGLMEASYVQRKGTIHAVESMESHSLWKTECQISSPRCTLVWSVTYRIPGVYCK